MSLDGSDGVMMIGLHPSAALEGSAPVMSASITEHGAAIDGGNVIAFPRGTVRAPGDVPAVVFGRDAALGRNVVAFAPRPRETSARFSKG